MRWMAAACGKRRHYELSRDPIGMVTLGGHAVL
jgi:hypothetical protein